MSRLNPQMHPLFDQSVIDALNLKNINTIPDFIETEIKHITIITNLTYKDVVNIRKHLINKNSAVIQDGLTYYKQFLQKSALLPTGIKNLDSILQGGFMTGNIYEVCGLPGTGKTQFCLTLAKNVVQNLKQYVYYIDTKRDFRGSRIKEMLESSHVSEVETAEIMSRILVKQINTKYELINCLYSIKAEMCKELRLRLIIVDSLPPLFYQITNYVKNYGVMNHFVNIMNLLCKEYHIVFLVTNTITTWYEGDFGMENKITEKLGLGKYWSNVSDTRITMKQCNEESQYELTISKSHDFSKPKSCIVNINRVGIF